MKKRLLFSAIIIVLLGVGIVLQPKGSARAEDTWVVTVLSLIHI